jgi:serine protease Do
MKEFYEFDEEHHQGKSSIKNYIIVALVFALIGGLVVYAISPYIMGQNGQTQQTDNSSNLPADENAAADTTDQGATAENGSLPTIGNNANLVINPNNPVVDISAKVEKAVVGITSTTEVTVPDFFNNSNVKKDVEAYGSGIIISEDGYVLTNNHVIEGAKQLYVIMSDGEKVDAKLVGTDPQSDVAVLKIDHKDLTVAKIGDSDKVQKGEFAIAIGNPLGHELAGTVNFGVISAADRTLQMDGKTMKLLQTDAAINQGNSGGALVNMRGEVIGMNTIKLGGELVEGLGFAIPSNVFKPLAEEIIKTGKVTYPEKPWLGVYTAEINEDTSKQLGYPIGILVTDVAQDSPALTAGIKPGDVITGLGGKDIVTFDELKEALNSHKIGEVVDVKLWRNGSDFVLKVKLGGMTAVD